MRTRTRSRARRALSSPGWLAGALALLCCRVAGVGAAAAEDAGASPLWPRPSLQALEQSPTATAIRCPVACHPSGSQVALLLSAAVPGAGSTTPATRIGPWSSARSRPASGFLCHVQSAGRSPPRQRHRLRVAVAARCRLATTITTLPSVQFMRSDGQGQWNEFVRRRSATRTKTWPGVHRRRRVGVAERDQFVRYRDIRKSQLEAEDYATTCSRSPSSTASPAWSTSSRPCVPTPNTASRPWKASVCGCSSDTRRASHWRACSCNGGSDAAGRRAVQRGRARFVARGARRLGTTGTAGGGGIVAVVAASHAATLRLVEVERFDLRTRLRRTGAVAADPWDKSSSPMAAAHGAARRRPGQRRYEFEFPRRVRATAARSRRDGIPGVRPGCGVQGAVALQPRRRLPRCLAELRRRQPWPSRRRLRRCDRRYWSPTQPSRRAPRGRNAEDRVGDWWLRDTPRRAVTPGRRAFTSQGAFYWPTPATGAYSASTRWATTSARRWTRWREPRGIATGEAGLVFVADAAVRARADDARRGRRPACHPRAARRAADPMSRAGRTSLVLSRQPRALLRVRVVWGE